MPAFAYRAFDAAGQIVEGELRGSDERDVLDALKTLELSPLSIRLHRAPAERGRPLLWRRRGVSASQVRQLTEQMASLLAAGLPLARVLEFLRDQPGSEARRAMLQAISDRVRQGEPLSQALQEYPDHFPEFYRAMVRAGEAGGVLEESMERVSSILERRNETRAQLRAAFSYPALMLFVMGLSIAVLLTFVVPRFSAAYQDLGAALPLPTRILVNTSSFISSAWWIFLLLGAGAALAVWRFARSERGRLTLDSAWLRVPVIGPLSHRLSLADYSSTLSSLLRVGVPILAAMEGTRRIIRNEALVRGLRAIEKEIQEGSSFANALRGHERHFPELMRNMVRTGEESGTLADMLGNLGRYYAREAASLTKTLSTVLEPAITLAMGALVGYIVIAMLLPIFEFSDLIR